MARKARWYQGREILTLEAARSHRQLDNWGGDDEMILRALLRAGARVPRLKRTMVAEVVKETRTGTARVSQVIDRAMDQGGLLLEYPDGMVTYRGAVRQCFEGWKGCKETGRAPGRKGLLAAPTGAGKTFIMSELARWALGYGWRVCVLVDRRALVRQFRDEFENHGEKIGYIWAGDSEWRPAPDPHARIQIIMRQSALSQTRKYQKAGLLPPWQGYVGAQKTLWFIDEGHEGLYSQVGQQICNNIRDSLLLVASATPKRTKPTEGLGDHLDWIAQTPLYQVLQDYPEERLITEYRRAGHPVPHIGALIPCTYKRMRAEGQIDTSEVNISQGDFASGQLQKASNLPELLTEQYRIWLEETGGVRRTATFCTGKQHAKDTGAFWAARGHGIAVILGNDSETYLLEAGSDKPIVRTRGELQEMFAKGKIKSIMSMGALTTGWDCPEAEVGLCLRDTLSWTLFMQMLGRVLRPCASIGKTRALWLDATRNLLRHTLPEDIPRYKLEMGAPAGTRINRDEEAGNKECPKCHTVVPWRTIKCPCGHHFGEDQQLKLAGVKLELEEIEASKKKKPKNLEERAARELRKLLRWSWEGNSYSRMWRGGRKNPDQALAMWYRKYPHIEIKKEWYAGALFPENARISPDTIRMVEIHLKAMALKRKPDKRARENDLAWIGKWMRRIFPDLPNSLQPGV